MLLTTRLTTKKYYLHTLWLLISFTPLAAHGSLSEQLHEVFNSMQQSSTPYAYETERRGMISGGGFNIRNNIKNTDLINFTLPNARGGCSGIDLYGGSFSYINKEEFTAFLRAVASNASSYAFQIALSSMCEKCMQHIETLQKKVQDLNQYFGNSCQLAQGVVNDSLAAFGRKGLNEASLVGQFEGVGDLFDLNTTEDPSEVFKKADQALPQTSTRISGNIIWQTLKDTPGFSNDTTLLESIMSITGSIIINDTKQEILTIPGGLITLQTLIEGGQTAIYKCNNTSDGGCLELKTTITTIKGLATLIKEVFDNPDNNGIIQKLVSNSGNFTTKELNLINSLPAGVMAKIRTLAAKSEGATRTFINDASLNLGFYLASNLIDNYLNQVEALISSSNHAYQKLMLTKLEDIKTQIQAEKLMLADLYAPSLLIEDSYKSLIEELPVNKYYLE